MTVAVTAISLGMLAVRLAAKLGCFG
jgi:hypothetical protein